jgi:hypothetical protein
MADHLGYRTCPLCKGDPSQAKPEVIAASPAEEMSFDQLQTYFIGLRKKQVFFTYSRCGQCGLLYCPVFFSEEALASLYSSMPDNTSVGGLEGTRRTQAGYAELFDEANVKEPFLDIGADIGLLTEAVQRTRKASSVCVEPNESVWPEIRTRLGEKVGIHKSIGEVPAGVMFSQIGAVHVLDHLLEPTKLLHETRQISAESGELLLVVHNEKSTLRRLLGNKWPPFCLQHPQLFNPATLRSILGSAGWSTITIGRTTNYISLGSGINNAMGLIGRGSFELSPRLSDITVPVRTGNMYALATHD